MVPQALAEVVAKALGEPVPCDPTEGDIKAEADTEGEGEAEKVALPPVALGVAVWDAQGQGVAEELWEREAVVQAVGEGVVVEEAREEAVRLPVIVTVEEREDVKDAERVTLEEKEGEMLGLCEAVSALEGEALLLGLVTVEAGVGEMEEVVLSVGQVVAEEDCEPEAAEEEEEEAEKVCVTLPVGEGAREGVELSVREPLMHPEVVREGTREVVAPVLPEPEGVAVREEECVGLLDAERR